MLKYTPEQEIELKNTFIFIQAADLLEEEKHSNREDFILKFMHKHKKTKRSVIAKLSKLGVYVSRPKVSKVTGDKAKTKDQMVTELTTKLGFSTNELEGLDKTPKLILVKLLKRINELTD